MHSNSLSKKKFSREITHLTVDCILVKVTTAHGENCAPHDMKGRADTRNRHSKDCSSLLKDLLLLLHVPQRSIEKVQYLWCVQSVLIIFKIET